MPKLSLEYVYSFIKNKGDELLSTEYVSCTSLLDIKCGVCNTYYKQTFSRFKNGCHHPYCGYRKPARLINNIVCQTCHVEFKSKLPKAKLDRKTHV